MAIFERCAIKGWPDKKAALHRVFRIQELFCEREALRLNHLLCDSAYDHAVWKGYASISIVHDRLEGGWTNVEEQVLSSSDATYAAVQNEIENLNAANDPVALEGPFRMARRDPELIAATHNLENKVRELDVQLSL
ncbi:MAG TPA: hypothetical protein VIE42_08985 [Steroidobacteraceae bacterium]